MQERLKASLSLDLYFMAFNRGSVAALFEIK